MSPTPLPDLKRIERTPDEADARMALWEAIAAVAMSVAGALIAAFWVRP